MAEDLHHAGHVGGVIERRRPHNFRRQPGVVAQRQVVRHRHRSVECHRPGRPDRQVVAEHQVSEVHRARHVGSRRPRRIRQDYRLRRDRPAEGHGGRLVNEERVRVRRTRPGQVDRAAQSKIYRRVRAQSHPRRGRRLVELCVHRDVPVRIYPNCARNVHVAVEGHRRDLSQVGAVADRQVAPDRHPALERHAAHRIRPALDRHATPHVHIAAERYVRPLLDHQVAQQCHVAAKVDRRPVVDRQVV